MTISDIRYLLKEDLKNFDKCFNYSLKSKIPLLNIIIKYLNKTKGKQMRPMFVYLVASLYGNINEKTDRAATLIELLHNATLVHDDVVDDANFRRGFHSIKSLWKNKIAVLIGDYILSQGLLLALENKDFQTLEIVSKATKKMSEGELLQLQKARSLKADIQSYFQVIEMKTASLLGSCFAAGAASANANQNEIDKMFEIGSNVGIAFQIKDDILDFANSNKTGKKPGNDIKEKKLNLPLLIYLKSKSNFQKTKELAKIKYFNKRGKFTKQLINEVRNNGALKEAELYMNSYLNKALDEIEKFDDSQNKDALKNLILYTTIRNK